jgi:hypothetical protein
MINERKQNTMAKSERQRAAEAVERIIEAERSATPTA